MSENVRRALHNHAVMPIWTSHLTATEVEELIDAVGSWVFCCGHIRDFVFTPLTTTRYKVTTKRRDYDAK